MLSLILALLAPSAQAEDVLVLYDSAEQDTPALVSALEAEGISVALSDVPEWQFDGTNPSLDGFRTVIHLNAAESVYNGQGAWELFMPTAGQEALVAFVRGGGGYIHSEWTAYEVNVGALTSMRDLVVITRSSADEGPRGITVTDGFETHPMWSELAVSFDTSGVFNRGPATTFDVSPATVVATDTNGNAAVVIRELDAGRIVGFHHTGNYFDGGQLTDPNLQQLYVNAVIWTIGCDLDQDGYARTGNCGGDDCNDQMASVNVDAPEYCNEIDNNCDGAVDLPDPVDGSTWYLDVDKDGYGDPVDPMLACDQPDGYVDNGDDCLDGNGDVHPGADEIPYDGLDNDCVDGDLCDVDDDGSDAPECGGLDCADDDASIHPDATEVWYDDIDQDCDGNDDDQDGDGYDFPEDCDDEDAAINPGAEEVGGDGIDNNCDGKTCGCQSTPAGGLWLIPALLGVLALRRRS